MTGRPFALIGVNSDKDLGKIREIIVEKKLNWRSFQNQPEGAATRISTEWGVKGWPTLIVIDEDFKIRYRGHDGRAASALAVKLTDQLEKKQQAEKLESKKNARRPR